MGSTRRYHSLYSFYYFYDCYYCCDYYGYYSLHYSFHFSSTDARRHRDAIRKYGLGSGTGPPLQFRSLHADVAPLISDHCLASSSLLLLRSIKFGMAYAWPGMVPEPLSPPEFLSHLGAPEDNRPMAAVYCRVDPRWGCSMPRARTGGNCATVMHSSRRCLCSWRLWDVHVHKNPMSLYTPLEPYCWTV